MKFVDYAKIFVSSGDGGAGHISFRREKFAPKGGPDGGNGGKGGDIILIVDPHMNTLLDFKYKRHYKAENGAEGGKSNKTGKNGKSIIIRVPAGTVVKNAEDGEFIADLTETESEFVVAEGGIGGRGNAEFATPTNQTPRYADPGRPGKEMEILLELKLIADAGLVGLPNAGKSTLISVISAARPKIADYPFTTLVPNLGIVRVGEYKNFTVADIPGLIEGAHVGKGLGIQFLRHVERTSVLVFLIDCMSLDPVNDYKTLRSELRKFNPAMEEKKKLICVTKIDAIPAGYLNEIKKLDFKDEEAGLLYISSVMNKGIDDLKIKLWEIISEEKEN